MPTLLIELLSEEIPPFMQKNGGEELARLLQKHLSDLAPSNKHILTGPRRIAVRLDVREEIPRQEETVRGPRVGAPPKAIEGFCRKHQTKPEELTVKENFYYYQLQREAVPAREHIRNILPDIIWHFSWPKSMRWGQGSHFTWIRPLRRIICLLDKDIIHFSLKRDNDNGHNLSSSNITQGHPYLSPEPFEVPDAKLWEELLYEHHVIASATKRKEIIHSSLKEIATSKNLHVTDDPKLLDEVTGMVEWPIIHLGSIDPSFMSLPPEILRISMRQHQKYFSLTDNYGKFAPFFTFVANIQTQDQGKEIVNGNERVLRARFSDALYFYTQDQKKTLASRVPSLDRVTFQENIGTQLQRTKRLEKLCRFLAPILKTNSKSAERAAYLSKADLTTDMVDEFPELQGIMGQYYARHDGESDEVAQAISDQYRPSGPHDDVPAHPVSIVLGLADRIDMLAAFFAAGKKPTGSKDPFALRRAALGIIRLIRKNELHIDLVECFRTAQKELPKELQEKANLQELITFMIERFQVQMRQEDIPHDRLAAIIRKDKMEHLDLVRLQEEINVLCQFLNEDVGHRLVAVFKRAKNILQIENKKDKTTNKERLDVIRSSAQQTNDRAEEEKKLYSSIEYVQEKLTTRHDFSFMLSQLAKLCAPIDNFFEHVLINDKDPQKRSQRLSLLAFFLVVIYKGVDLSQIKKMS